MRATVVPVGAEIIFGTKRGVAQMRTPNSARHQADGGCASQVTNTLPASDWRIHQVRKAEHC